MSFLFFIFYFKNFWASSETGIAFFLFFLLSILYIYFFLLRYCHAPLDMDL